MGDEDAYDLAKCSAKQAIAMAKLIGMNATIDADDSGYYEVPKTLDESLRERHPALQDAWEKYQSILTICKQDHYSKET